MFKILKIFTKNQKKLIFKKFNLKNPNKTHLLSFTITHVTDFGMSQFHLIDLRDVT